VTVEELANYDVDERAAIMEYDGGLPRAEAEAEARRLSVVEQVYRLQTAVRKKAVAAKRKRR
jgi:hypothetical protein